jgi:hypothetical protein
VREVLSDNNIENLPSASPINSSMSQIFVFVKQYSTKIVYHIFHYSPHTRIHVSMQKA